MAKLVPAAALLLLFAVAAASAATTITTTTVVTEVDDANPTQQCQQQIQQQRQQLRHCTMWLQSRCSRSPRNVNLRMAVAEAEVINPREEEQHRDQCCSALERVDEQCRCEAVTVAVQGVRSEGRVQEEEMREVRSMAQNLPGRCGFEPRQCQIRAVWF